MVIQLLFKKVTSFIFDSMEKWSITAVDDSLQLKIRLLLSLLAFIKLSLNHLKGSSDDVSDVLTTDCFFSFAVYILQFLNHQGSKKGHIVVYQNRYKYIYKGHTKRSHI